jgi:hypothetical protein
MAECAIRSPLKSRQADRGIVDENVQGADLPHRLLDQPPDFFDPAKVAGSI